MTWCRLIGLIGFRCCLTRFLGPRRSMIVELTSLAFGDDSSISCEPLRFSLRVLISSISCDVTASRGGIGLNSGTVFCRKFWLAVKSIWSGDVTAFGRLIWTSGTASADSLILGILPAVLRFNARLRFPSRLLSDSGNPNSSPKLRPKCDRNNTHIEWSNLITARIETHLHLCTIWHLPGSWLGTSPISWNCNWTWIQNRFLWHTSRRWNLKTI